LSEDEYGSYVEGYQQYLFEEIERNKFLIDNHNSKLEKIATLEEECDKRKENINILRKEIREIEDEILSLKDELNVPYY
jgi:peptidoglycan hydrolase CwlO-like protein